FFSQSTLHQQSLHSFPTRRSSDLKHYLGRSAPVEFTQRRVGSRRQQLSVLRTRRAVVFLADIPIFVRSLSRRYQLSSRRFPNSRSEEHTSELQSQSNLVCRLLLEK